MSTFTPSTPWLAALSQHLTQTLECARLAHAPLADGNPSSVLATRWRLPARPAQASRAAAALSQMLGAGGPAVHASLFTRCLQHYRAQLAADTAEDDLGLALAAYLGACRQAVDHEALTPHRWQAIVQWLAAWVIDELPWDDAPLAQRQDAFERFAVLAVALGEWTVQASRQGGKEQLSAVWMARSSLRDQLDLDLDTLCAVLRGLDAPIAANPSVVFEELGVSVYRQPGADPV